MAGRSLYPPCVGVYSVKNGCEGKTISYREGWQVLLDELTRRTQHAQAMGGAENVAKQHQRGRLHVRERIESLFDAGSFNEIGALAGGNHPAGAAALAGDGLVAGIGRLAGQSTAVIAEDFTVKGGSIGHANAAKRARMVRLALEQGLPLVLLLDGAGERAGNGSERYPNAPGDLQLVADAKGRIPVVTAVLGVSAGHGALTGMFADLIVMSKGSSMFTAGPPLVEAALGIKADPEELGGAVMHTSESGVAHNFADSEQEALAMVRYFISMVSNSRVPSVQQAGLSTAAPRSVEELLDLIPPVTQQAYDMRRVLNAVVDRETMFELQPDYGASLITAIARMGGQSCMLMANQPQHMAGAITTEAALKASHFIDVANAFRLPLISLVDNPGVMPGPDAERSGVLRAAGQMFAAQRRFKGTKIVVTLRKAFGFGSSVMGMNPWDRQAISLALPSVTLGGVPAIGGAEAARASQEEAQQMQELQSGAWVPADAMAFDKVIDPVDLRNEILDVLKWHQPRGDSA